MATHETSLGRLRSLRGRITHAKERIDAADRMVTVGELAAALRRELHAAEQEVAALIHDAKASRELEVDEAIAAASEEAAQAQAWGLEPPKPPNSGG